MCNFIFDNLPVLTGILCCDSGDRQLSNTLDRATEPDNSELLSGPPVSRAKGQPWSLPANFFDRVGFSGRRRGHGRGQIPGRKSGPRTKVVPAADEFSRTWDQGCP